MSGLNLGYVQLICIYLRLKEICTVINNVFIFLHSLNEKIKITSRGLIKIQPILERQKSSLNISKDYYEKIKDKMFMEC